MELGRSEAPPRLDGGCSGGLGSRRVGCSCSWQVAAAAAAGGSAAAAAGGSAAEAAAAAAWLESVVA